MNITSEHNLESIIAKTDAAPPLTSPATSQPKDECCLRPVSTVCRRRQCCLPGLSLTGFLPIGHGDQHR
jgi:hypothetical protein